jgi:hypothetical protein
MREALMHEPPEQNAFNKRTSKQKMKIVVAIHVMQQQMVASNVPVPVHTLE